MLRHMYHLPSNDATMALCRSPLGLVRMDWSNVNCDSCLAMCGDIGETDYQKLFVSFYKATAACEPPGETQLAEVLDTFGSQFNSANIEADSTEDSEKMYLVCIKCGEAFDSIHTALEHGTADLSGMSGWCGDEGFNILPESEAF